MAEWILELERGHKAGRCELLTLLERALIAAMNAAIEPFLAKHTRPDGTLIWGGTAEQYGRDDVDDFYEAFYNWPLLYLPPAGDAAQPEPADVSRPLGQLSFDGMDFDWAYAKSQSDST